MAGLIKQCFINIIVFKNIIVDAIKNYLYEMDKCCCFHVCD